MISNPRFIGIIKSSHLTTKYQRNFLFLDSQSTVNNHFARATGIDLTSLLHS